MTVYEIDKRIEEILEGSVDEETGELTIDVDELETLSMEREAKLEHCAAAYKNYLAEAAAIKQEVDALNKRIKRLKTKAESAAAFLELNLGEDEQISSPRVKAYRKTSKVTQVDDTFIPWARENGRDDLLRIKDPEPDKTAIAKLIKSGTILEHAWLEEKKTLKVE